MILEKIVLNTRERIADLTPVPAGNRKIISLKSAIMDRNKRNAIIAEIKFASPSRGTIRTGTTPVDAARELITGGCSALSVLTEPTYFHGDVAYIPLLRPYVNVPILRKDFIIDRRQLVETKFLGADAVLLITAVLGECLGEFVDETIRLGLEPLVEVHSRDEARVALDTNAEIIGVNNRDLRTLQTDLSTTRSIAPLIHNAGKIVISESGMIWPCDIRSLRRFADAYLIGSSIMASRDPVKRLEGFVSA